MATFSFHFHKDSLFPFSPLYSLLWGILISLTEVLPRPLLGGRWGGRFGWGGGLHVWWFMLCRTYCGPLHPLDAGLGKPFWLSAALSIWPMTLPSEWPPAGSPGALLFLDMTGAYLLVSDSSHTDADVTPILGLLGNCDHPLPSGNLWGDCLTCFCCNGPWGFGLCCLAVHYVGILRDSEIYSLCPHLSPSPGTPADRERSSMGILWVLLSLSTFYHCGHSICASSLLLQPWCPPLPCLNL